MITSRTVILISYVITALAQDVQIPSTLHLNGTFPSQVETLIQSVRLSKDEIEKFPILHDDAIAVLKRRWSGVRLVPFGSTETGLAMMGSDIDYYVDIPEHIHATHSPTELIEMTEKSLRKFSRLFQVDKVSLNFKVPSLRFTHKPTKAKADLIFNPFIADHETRLTKYLISLDHRVYPLMMVVKFWAKLHELIVSRQMPSYGWMQLVIFYLQHIGILPPIFTLQRGKPIYQENWNIQFDESTKDLYFPNSTYSLYELLGGFFQYYADFDFANHVISTYTAMAIRREFFEDLKHLPTVFQDYKYNVKNNLTKELDVNSLLCIQNSLVHNANVGTQTPDELADRIVAYIQKAADLFEEVHEKEFLPEILYMTYEDVMGMT